MPLVQWLPVNSVEEMDGLQKDMRKILVMMQIFKF